MLDYSNWSVLIVEDEEDAQAVLRSLLGQYSIPVATTFSAEEALDLLHSEHPTVAIIDLGLPGMDGWELLAKMRATPAMSHIPAVAMTAFHSSNVAQKAISAGFVAYFPKPINARTFVKDLIQILK